MKKFGLLALVLCVAMFTLGCPQETKKQVKIGPPAGTVQTPPGDLSETPPADTKKAETMPAEQTKTEEAKPAEEKKAE